VSNAKGGSIVSDGNLHMVALVANQTSISFYADAKLQSVITLTRPITDCTGRALIMGANDIPRLGEITVSPRQLGETEMDEIMSSGFTLDSLASGKQTFIPERTPFDAAGAIQAASFAKAESQLIYLSAELQVENSFDRLVTEIIANPVVRVVLAKIAVTNQPVSLRTRHRRMARGVGEKEERLLLFWPFYISNANTKLHSSN
jgi:hypothetical protein